MCQPKRIDHLLFVLLIAVTSTVSAATDTSDYPAWMRDAIIYGIKPNTFVQNASYDDITLKIPELKFLGINTIWLQPVFKTSHGGQGYDITDFFSLRADLGSPLQLKKLIAAAKSNGIRVLFDFVPNHTSIDHPYAIDVIQKGKASAYYDYYQHDNDGAPYCSFYHKDSAGFICYFWENLVNLNYNNEKVQRMIIDACKYWVKEYDIDGYRFDAVWAVNARAPEFGKRLRAELKAIKPGILLLAEDKGRSEEVYEKGFDAAYDWTNDTAWVSQWSWQYKHHAKNSLTVFNHPDISKRKKLLSLSLFTDTKNNFRLLRFLENNDLPRFIMGHSLGQTRMAAEILFSLPGIPLIFSGQETGFRGHPYSGKNTFETGKTIEAQDSLGLFRFYQNIISKRSTHQALKSSEIKEIPVGAPTVIVYSRGSGQDRVIVVANLDSSAAKIALSHKLFPKKTIDLLTGRKIRIQTGKELSVAGYGVLWLSEAKREDLQYLKNQ